MNERSLLLKGLSQMDSTEIESIIPLQLLRRINRLIKIDDVFADEISTSSDENGLLREGDLESKDVKICVEPRLEPKPLHEVKTNWIDRFCKSDRMERIIWDSKLHREAREFENKSMYEQVEELMDMSAEDFAECINKLTDDEQHHISKEMIRKLFSIEIENDLSKSVFVRKTQMPFVSKEIAEMFQCPELAIERNIRRIIKQSARPSNIVPKYHAFGRSLSPTSKQVQKSKFIEPERFKFPPDIESGEILFKGIDHLKTTKKLMNYLEEHNLPKPKYLVEMNAKSNDPSRQTPLHSFYQ